MARNRNFVDGSRILNANLAASAGTTDKNGDSIDTVDCESIVFVVTMGSIAATAVTSLKVQSRDSSSDSWADETGASMTIAANDDNDVFVLELVKPLKRYVRGVVDRGIANATIVAGLAFLTHNRKEPVTHGSIVNVKKVIGS